MANPEFGIRVGDLTLWTLEIDLGDRPPTQLARGNIKLKVLVPGTEELYELFSQEFFSTPGIHFSTLKSGVASYDEVRFILEQMSGGVWSYSHRHVPVERGEFQLPQGVFL